MVKDGILIWYADKTNAFVLSFFAPIFSSVHKNNYLILNTLPYQICCNFFKKSRFNGIKHTLYQFNNKY